MLNMLYEVQLRRGFSWYQRNLGRKNSNSSTVRLTAFLRPIRNGYPRASSFQTKPMRQAFRVKNSPLPSRAFAPSLQISSKHWMPKTHELPSWKNSSNPSSTNFFKN